MIALAITILCDVASWILLMGGAFFLVVGGVGVLRFPDFYTRLHAAGVTDTGGAILILCGLMLQGAFHAATIKLLLILIFFLFTSPTATHALANAAYWAGERPHPVEDRAAVRNEADA